MRVLYVWSFFQPDLKYHIHFLAQEMVARHNHEVDIIASSVVNKEWLPYLANPRCGTGPEDYDDIPVHRLSSINVVNKPIPTDFKRIRNLVKSKDFDVVHMGGLSSIFDYVVLAVIRATARNKFIVVQSDHSHPTNTSSSIVGRAYYAFCKALFWLNRKYIKLVFTPTVASKEYLQDRYKLPDGKLVTIPLGYDSEIFRIEGRQRTNQDKLVVGFAGKVNPAKQVDKLLSAIHETGQKDLFECHIAGMVDNDEYSESLKSMAESLDIDVKFYPMLNPHELADFYRKIDLAVFPGSISITTLEATGCGTPVIVFEAISGLEHRVSNGRGQLFTDYAELPALLNRYLDKKHQGDIDARRIARESEPYSWQCIASRYNEYYESLHNQAFKRDAHA